jgi:hypothetical protein
MTTSSKPSKPQKVSKKIFSLIKALDVFMDSDLVPPKVNKAISSSRTVAALAENLWEVFHQEDAAEAKVKLVRDASKQAGKAQA